ncbi:MAG: hypothetical protein Q4C97_09410 [Bacillota bacterium]|nr:hypothetical protein [Bacillota bacterium]
MDEIQNKEIRPSLENILAYVKNPGRSNMYGWDWGSRLPDAGMWRDVIWKILLPIRFRVWISVLSLPGNSENFYRRIG